MISFLVIIIAICCILMTVSENIAAINVIGILIIVIHGKQYSKCEKNIKECKVDLEKLQIERDKIMNNRENANR